MGKFLNLAVGIVGVGLLAAAPVWAMPGGGKGHGGIPGENNWVVVDPAGVAAPGSYTPLRQFSTAGTITAEHVANGQWEITFSKDVSACAYQATIGDPGIKQPPLAGFISVSGNFDPDAGGGDDTDTGNNVYVQTVGLDGSTLTDLPFHLLVTCPQ